MRQALSLPLNAAGLGAASLWLLPADFGIWAILLLSISGAFSLIDLGLTKALVQNESMASNRILRQVQVYKLCAAVTCVGGLWVAAELLARHFALLPQASWLLASCGGVAWLQSQRGHQSIWLQRDLGWERLAAIEVIEIVAYNVCLVMGAYVFRSATAFVAALGVRMLIGTVLLYLPRRAARHPVGEGIGHLKDLFRFGLPYQLTTVLSMIQQSLNPIIVGSVAGLSAAGFVNWSIYVAGIPVVPLQPMYAFLFSIISERQRKGADSREAIVRILRIGTISAAGLSLLAALLLPPVVGRFMDSPWAGVTSVAVVFLLGNSLTVPSAILTTHLTALGHSRAWLRIVLIETLLIWSVGVVGLMAWGVVGYAVGLVAANSMVLLVGRRALEKSANVTIGIRDLFGPGVLTFLAFGMATLVARLAVGTPILRDGLQVVSGLVAWTGLLYLTLGRTAMRDLRELLPDGLKVTFLQRS